ncbi:MAG: methylglyoxal synthase [Ignavibacterium sp.]
MKTKIIKMEKKKRIALIAHDNKKYEMLEWAKFNKDLLAEHELYATGTTGHLLATELNLNITRFKSGPLGGDQQIGAKISEGEIDFVFFFWDPLSPLSHDVDVKALLRIAVVYNIPIACNRSTADYLISSDLMHKEYPRIVPNYDDFIIQIEEKIQQE